MSQPEGSVRESQAMLGELYDVIRAKDAIDFAEVHHKVQRLKKNLTEFNARIPLEKQQLIEQQEAASKRLEYVNANIRGGFLGWRLFESDEERDEQDNLRGEKELLEAKVEQLANRVKDKDAEENILLSSNENLKHVIDSFSNIATKRLSETDIEQQIACWRTFNLMYAMTDSVAAKVKCANAAKEAFKKILQNLPPELGILSVLQAVGENHKIETLLNDYFTLKPDDRLAYTNYLLMVAKEVNQIAEGRAKEALLREGQIRTDNPAARGALNADPLRAARDRGLVNENPLYGVRDQIAKGEIQEAMQNAKKGAKEAYDMSTQERREAIENIQNESRLLDLPPDVQQKLIEQRAFLIKMSAYLDLSDLPADNPLRLELIADYKKLENNIHNVLINHQNIEQAERDSAAVKAKLEAREQELATHIFRQKAYTTTYAKAAVIGVVGGAAATKIAWMFGYGNLGNLAGVYAVGTIPALYEIANEESQKMAKEEMRAAGLNEDMNAIDAAYIMQVDKIFSMQTAKPKSEIHVKQDSVIGLSKKIAWKSWIQFPLRIFNKLPLPIRVIVGTIIVVTVVAPLVLLVAFVPPAWPVAATVGAVLLTAAAAYGVNAYGGGVARGLVSGSSAVSRAGIATLEFVTRPFRDLATNFREGNLQRGILKVGLAIAVGAIGAVVLPIALPSMALAAAIGGLAGAYLGMSAGSVGERLHVDVTKPMEIVDVTYVKKLDDFDKPRNFELTGDQVDFLKSLTNIQGFDAKFKALFIDRHADIVARINAERSKNLHDPEVVAKITHDGEKLIEDWHEILNTVGNPEEFCNVLDRIVFEQAQVEREKLLKTAKSRSSSPVPSAAGVEGEKKLYSERVRKMVGFGAKKNGQVEPESYQDLTMKKPDFNMEENQVNYRQERAAMDKLIEMQNISKTIRQHIRNR
jgi:hypothetical protein